ncbi:MAG TPA: TlpA disulfide reductase family protein [Solirubrobacteraceae bacterium]|nr:TlpA disulfide reductase family protein [Solirubrobacteraceae bacterium]
MKRRILPILITVVGAGLIGLLIYGVSHQAASRSIDEQIGEGREPVAPDASEVLPALGAAGHSSLAALRGKVVLLNFWASWCEPCQVEAPLLEKWQGRLAGHGATVLGVTYLDASPDSEAFVARYHLTYPNLRDDTGDFAHAYGTDKLPESFVINRAGRVVALSRGEIDERFVERALAVAEKS